ncbi:hypothetical protein BP5796_05478 [Coleophoma crateriformis]|uniref:Aflatoxin regulatory protein domain-containing protein n=1 Tax=Coleophoma crateriformis TaxID=565419 RepID=A0A3D8S3N6_9HELO|nr:hypothetical protein BP5796_05478 [Coleophoma crateriformis]
MKTQKLHVLALRSEPVINATVASLGKPVGKPSKHGRGREKMQPAKRLRSPGNDAEPDSSGVTESLNGRKRRHVETDIQISPDGDCVDSNGTVLTFEDPPSFFCPIDNGYLSSHMGDTGLLSPVGLCMDFDQGFDDMSCFGFLGNRSRRSTPAPISMSALASDNLSSAVEPSPPQLWTPAFLKFASDLYTVLQSTVIRLDRILLLARQGLDVVTSCLSHNSSIDTVLDISASTMRPSSPNSLLACIFLVQQVSASYGSMRSHISSRRLQSRPESLNPSRSASISSALDTSIDKETFGESFCIGDFKVEDLESQCNLVEAVVTVEIKRFREVLTGLEMWARELSKDGKREGKLAELILKSLAKSLPTRSRPSSAAGSFEMS